MDAEGISQLFAAPVSAWVATPEMYDAPLFPEEQEAVARGVLRRRREFAAGRACARVALSRLGVVPVPIPQGADRAPIWPDGYVGSITHCPGFCGAVSAPSRVAQAVGLDAETADPLPPDMARLVCRPDELDRFAAQPEPVGSTWPKLTFSAKEAFYKYYFPLSKTHLGFEEVSIWFTGGPAASNGGFRVVLVTAGKPLGGLQNAFRGRWRVAGARVYAGVILPAPPA